MMRWAKITWKPSATAQDRIDCMGFIHGVADPAMPSEYFINDVWLNEMGPPDPDLVAFDDLTETLAHTLAGIPSDGHGWHFKIGARQDGPSWQGNINISTAIDVLTAIKGVSNG